jgi:hypothetical protein
MNEPVVLLEGTLTVGSFNKLSNVPILRLLNVVVDVISPDGAKYAGAPGRIVDESTSGCTALVTTVPNVI